jgi:hypothetical protein
MARISRSYQAQSLIVEASATPSRLDEHAQSLPSLCESAGARPPTIGSWAPFESLTVSSGISPGTAPLIRAAFAGATVVSGVDEVAEEPVAQR